MHYNFHSFAPEPGPDFNWAQKSESPETEILFRPIYTRQLCKNLCQLIYPLNCFLGMRKKPKKRFYTIDECGIAEPVDLDSKNFKAIGWTSCLNWSIVFFGNRLY